MGEIEAAEEATDATARATRQAVQKKHMVELSATLDERVGKLKEQLHVS